MDIFKNVVNTTKLSQKIVLIDNNFKKYMQYTNKTKNLIYIL